jgi:hypothetical protein
MDSLIVDSVKVSDGRLEVHFNCEGQVKKFFGTTKFFAEYNVSIESVPEHILIIPFLSTVCPVAWANGADIKVKTIDRAFLQSLRKIKNTYSLFYPEIHFDGEVHADNVVSSSVDTNGKAMILFSGGLDSVATYIRHEKKQPILVAIHGTPDMRANDFKGWSLAYQYLKSFAENIENPLRTVRSNFYDVVDDLMLRKFYEKLDGGWWERIMHGLVLLGVCAPLTFVDKVQKLYIASTFSQDFHAPWGSAPEIDNNISWAGVNCQHDGYELTRQQKIELFADYTVQTQRKLPIRVCSWRGNGANCSSNKCEKCSRTIVGLELAGLDPNNHGFNVTTDSFMGIKESLENDKWPFGADEKWMWTDLQRYARQHKRLPHHEAELLTEWLATADVGAIGAKKHRERRILKGVIPIFKYLPYPLCYASSKTYNALKLAYKQSVYKTPEFLLNDERIS